MKFMKEGVCAVQYVTVQLEPHIIQPTVIALAVVKQVDLRLFLGYP